uniref:Uncharacterized protein n=1 Tax=Parastrongyloides trichosuri TaxID=131310 RepID=A0A0N4Z9P5_PARTI
RFYVIFKKYNYYRYVELKNMKIILILIKKETV